MATANLLQTSVSGGTQNALSLQGDGVFFPKASTTSRLALTLTTTDKGFIVYDTTDNNIYFWNGAAWESIPGSGDAGANGSVQYNDNGIVSGASNFVYDKATSAVSITGAATVGTTLGVTGVTTLTGNVGVGNAPSAWTLTAVQVGKGSIYGAGNETGYLGNAYYGSGGFKYIAAAGASFYQQNGGVHQWYTAAAGAAPNDPVTTFTTTKMALSAAGDLSITSGNLVMGTSGKGIDFTAAGNAFGMTSELLNDYEEGTWTGTLTGSTTNPTVAVTATGRYTKIGRQVSISINFESVSTAGASGNIGISGLPFANNASVQSIGPTGIYQAGTFTGSPFIRVDTAAFVIEFFASVSNAVYSNVTHNAGTARFIATSVSYTVA